MNHMFHTLVALHIPKKHAEFIIFANHIVGSMMGNPYFPSPVPVLPTVTAHIQVLQTAETNAKSRTKGAAETRDLALQQVTTDIHQLAAYVQTAADSKPGEAAAIITSAGFGVRTRGVHVKPDLAARQTPGGVVTLRAKSVGKHVAYEWQMSADGGKTWTPLPATRKATTSVGGLAFGTTYVFRFRGNVNEQPGDWHEPATLLLH